MKETTLSGYRHSLEKHVLPKWGRYRLVDIGHSDVQAWISGLAKTHAPSTVRQIFLTLSGLMKYAIVTAGSAAIHATDSSAEGHPQDSWLSHA